MNMIKHLVAVATLTVAGTAAAATYDVGALAIGLPQSLTYGVHNGSFTDVINFDITAPSTGQFNAVTFTLGFGGFNTPISGLTLTVFDGATALTPVAGAYTLATGTNYSFAVSGVSQGNGLYSVNYMLTAAPVPEPGTVAMLLAGLGVTGLIVSRRSRA